MKLALHPAADLMALAAAARRHAGHLSRNALRDHGDGGRERFVTQRCHGVGRETATGRLGDLLAALARLGHPVLDVEEEFVVHDSYLGLDAEWIDTPSAAPDPPAVTLGRPSPPET